MRSSRVPVIEMGLGVSVCLPDASLRPQQVFVSVRECS